MANYCSNKMTLTGPQEELERFRELFKDFDYQFTYQAIIPQPAGLDIPSGSANKTAIALYLYQTAANDDIRNLDIELIRKWDKDNSYGLLDQNGDWAKDAMEKVVAEYGKHRKKIAQYDISGIPCATPPKADDWPSSREQLYKYGEQLIRNVAETGYETWYEWNCANWGVKWDAGDSNEVEICGECIFLPFSSPWGPPDKVFKAITEQFPELTLTVEIDCEGTGCWTITGKAGELSASEVRAYWEDEEDEEIEEDEGIEGEVIGSWIITVKPDESSESDTPI